MQYVYGTCNVNGCINEDGSGDFLLLPIGLFKLFSSYCRDLLVCYVQKIHVIELREAKSLNSPNSVEEIL